MHMCIVSEISFTLVFKLLIVIIFTDFYLKINGHQYLPNIILAKCWRCFTYILSLFT